MQNAVTTAKVITIMKKDIHAALTDAEAAAVTNSYL
jgi:hypothetical protein